MRSLASLASRFRFTSLLAVAITRLCGISSAWAQSTPPDGLYIRFKLQDTEIRRYYVKLGGFIHNDPWYLPTKIFPDGADKPIVFPLQGKVRPPIIRRRPAPKSGQTPRIQPLSKSKNGLRAEPAFKSRQPSANEPEATPNASVETAPTDSSKSASTPRTAGAQLLYRRPPRVGENSVRWFTNEFSPWIDLNLLYGKLLHGRLNRSGGVAEFPNLTIEIFAEADGQNPQRDLVIELATAPGEASVVKSFNDKFQGSLTSVLVSPNLAADKDSLELASQMAQRHLEWAKQATGGVAYTPKQLILETTFWAPERPEVNLIQAEAARLLGFSMINNQSPEVAAKNFYKQPGATHDVTFAPSTTREKINGQIAAIAPAMKKKLTSGSLLHFSDEVTAGRCLNLPEVREMFIAWLQVKGITPGDVGLSSFDNIPLLDTPEQLKAALAINPKANRIFYLCCRFRQEVTTERFGWLTEEAHRQIRGDLITSTLFPDHPYLGGTGMGMGMTADHTWGSFSLAIDWFEMARTKAVDLIGTEDWLGLQYMFGPDSTFEGFQLMGFFATLIRSGGHGDATCMTWITPSDENNLRLKSASAMAQGSKHIYFWAYGPTATSTENYWSDIRSAYDGMAHLSKQMAKSEHIIGPGKTRTTKVAILYSISSDIWQPYEYVHMLNRRGLYYSLIHDQYLVDFIPEEDILAGRLTNYDVLYTSDPCLHEGVVPKIDDWVKQGGWLIGTCGAGSRNQYNEPVDGLATIFGLKPGPTITPQTGNFWYRGAWSGIPYTDEMNGQFPSGKTIKLGVIGTKATIELNGATAIATYKDGGTAATTFDYGSGKAIYFGSCPGITYFKEAGYVLDKLAEKWPAEIRTVINAPLVARPVQPLLKLSHPIVEAGVYDAPAGTALVLANFTYAPIDELQVRLATPKGVTKITSIESGNISFALDATLPTDPAGWTAVTFKMKLGINDIVLLE